MLAHLYPIAPPLHTRSARRLDGRPPRVRAGRGVLLTGGGTAPSTGLSRRDGADLIDAPPRRPTTCHGQDPAAPAAFDPVRGTHEDGRRRPATAASLQHEP